MSQHKDRGDGLWGFLLDCLHLWGLSSFAVAQPLFSVLARNAEFFSVRRSEPVDIVILAVFLAFIVPVPLMALEFAAGLVSGHLRRVVHGVFVGALIGLAVLTPLHRTISLPGALALGVAAAAGAVGSFLYLRSRSLRPYFTLLALAVPVFALVFLTNSSVRKVLAPGEPPEVLSSNIQSTTPLLLLIFDALPLSSLLDGDRQIDDVRYPNFAALARDGVWFRGATTVSDNTIQAVPAILTGRYPRPGQHPTAADHPENLFTLLGGSHEMRALEAVTGICPESLCAKRNPLGARISSLLADVAVIFGHVVLPADLTGGLGSVGTSWRDFGDGGDPDGGYAGKVDFVGPFLEFVDSIDSDSSPALFFHHAVLPHAPHRYFPSGTAYTRKNWEPSGQGGHWGAWANDEWAVEQCYQRHLLQVGFVDALLGKLLDRLRASGLYDETLIVVTADHGVSYRAGGSHRALSPENIGDIMSVPLLMKFPADGWPNPARGFRPGHIDDSNVQVIDVLPTVASAMGITLPWQPDGIDLFHYESELPNTKTCYQVGEPMVIPVADLETRYETLERKLQTFGSGRNASLFAWGPDRDVIGRSIDEFDFQEPAKVKVGVHELDKYRTVDRSSGFVPAAVTGFVEARGLAAEDVRLAIAVNSVIHAVTKPYDNSSVWSALLPEAALGDGANAIDVFMLRREGERRLLTPTVRVDEASFLDLPLGGRAIIGVADRGFFTTASWDGVPVRWTDGDALLVVPLRDGEMPGALHIDLVRASPEVGVPTQLRLALNETELYSGPVPEGPWARTFSLANIPAARQAEIEISSSTFVPSEVVEGLQDSRALGVAVRGVVLRTAEP